MRIQKVYLESSIFNFCFADDAPDKRQDTWKLFEEIKERKYDPYTSFVTVDELNKTKDSLKREKMLALINEYDIGILDDDAEADVLADDYVREGIIPIKYRDDALHIAVATIAEMTHYFELEFSTYRQTENPQHGQRNQSP